MSLFNFKKRKIQGYVYVPKGDKLLRNSKVGDRVIKADKTPPYIVVDHAIETIIITQWPGKLFKVEVINPSKEEYINKGLVKDVWYTRTFGVRLLKEVETKVLFGVYGHSIEQILNLTQNITKENVEELSKIESGMNRLLFSKAWQNWIKMHDIHHPFANEDHFDTIKISLINQKRNSPINEAFAIISAQFSIRAKQLVGSSAFRLGNDGETFLQPIWANAIEKINHAAMSYASDSILSASERQDLRTPFNKVFKIH